MTLFSLVLAFLLEQWRPVDDRNRVLQAFLSYADQLKNYFNTGMRRHEIAAWIAALAPILMLSALLYYFLYSLSPILAWALNAGALYFAMGFRQFSTMFAEIRDALRAGELLLARELLGRWLSAQPDEVSHQEIARDGIESALVYSHRHVFGIIVSFILLPGPVGPVLYRLAGLLSDHWSASSDLSQESEPFGDFAGRAFEVIDWLPARSTALSFAIAGNFEDALYCWRVQSASWADQTQGIILASGAGALGVRLGDSENRAGRRDRPELGVGKEADADSMQSTIGLIWRTLMLWFLLLLLLETAVWIG